MATAQQIYAAQQQQLQMDLELRGRMINARSSAIARDPGLQPAVDRAYALFAKEVESARRQSRPLNEDRLRIDILNGERGEEAYQILHGCLCPPGGSGVMGWIGEKFGDLMKVFFDKDKGEIKWPSVLAGLAGLGGAFIVTGGGGNGLAGMLVMAALPIAAALFVNNLTTPATATTPPLPTPTRPSPPSPSPTTEMNIDTTTSLSQPATPNGAMAHANAAVHVPTGETVSPSNTPMLTASNARPQGQRSAPQGTAV